MGPHLTPPESSVLLLPLPLLPQPIPPSVLQIIVQRSSRLLPDVFLTNPVVRVHVLEASTGNYLRSLTVPGVPLDPGMQAQVGLVQESGGVSTGGEGGHQGIRARQTLFVVWCGGGGGVVVGAAGQEGAADHMC